MIEVIFILLITIVLIFAAISVRGGQKIGGSMLQKRQKELDYWDYTATQKFLAQIEEPISKLLQHADTIMNFDDIPRGLEYISTKSVIKTPLHNGQVKLFLTELRFLTECADPRAVVVYAGSAPSNKLKYLAELFPAATFVLIDPNEHLIMYPGHKTHYDHGETLYFCANPAPKFAPVNSPACWWADGAVKRGRRSDIPAPGTQLPSNLAEIIRAGEFKFYIIEDYFGDKTAELLSSLGCYFISDIRSQFSSEEAPRDIDILWNSAMMYNWLEILAPARFMLKFRTPYGFDAKIDEEFAAAKYSHGDFARCKIKFIENYRVGKFEYIDPEVMYMQAFAGPTSTESRLVGSKLTTKEWNVRDYNDKYFYYNRAHRSYGWHDVAVDRALGIDHCGDCAIMMKTFDMYRAKFSVATPTVDMVSRLLYVCRRNLFDGSIHGYYLTQYKSFAELIKTQAAAYRAMVVELVIKPPAVYRPLSKAQAQIYNDLLGSLEANSARRLLPFLIIAWAFGWDSPLVSRIVAPKFNARDIDFVEFRDRYLAAPAVPICSTGVIRLSDDTCELTAPEFEEYSRWKILSRGDVTINGRAADYNIFIDNMFELPRDKYLIYVPNLSQLLRKLLIDNMRAGRNKFVMVVTNDPDKNTSQFVATKHSKIITADYKKINGEIGRREFLLRSE